MWVSRPLSHYQIVDLEDVDELLKCKINQCHQAPSASDDREMRDSGIQTAVPIIESIDWLIVVLVMRSPAFLFC